jgi:FixJ family two-component response regulator
MMPKIDGVSLATRLQAQGLGIPVVLLSAVYNDVALLDVQFLPKPFEVDDLLWVIARTLEDRAHARTQAVVRGPFTKWRG